MRVIAGSAGGRKLITPEGMDVRPTAEKVKEAVFSSIQFEIEGRRVLDLFAGSGQMAIEALSRGAAEGVFVDSSRTSAELVRKNIAAAGFENVSRVANTEAAAFLGSTEQIFDIAFLDPPYNKQLINGCFERLVKRMAAGGIIICETQFDEALPEGAGEFTVYREYKYSKTRITVYRDR